MQSYLKILLSDSANLSYGVKVPMIWLFSSENILFTSIGLQKGLAFLCLFFRSMIYLRDMELFFELEDFPELDPVDFTDLSLKEWELTEVRDLSQIYF